MILVIIAGGKGTRLGLKDIPKPMVQIGGKPLLEYQIDIARRYGVKEVYILSGYMSDVINEYFKDGNSLGINITYIVEKEPLGTAGTVKQLEGMVNERFMVFYGDVLFDIDLGAFIEFDKQYTSLASIIVHPNDHPYDSDLINIDENNTVTALYPKHHDNNKYYRNLVNAAVYILDPKIFKYIPADKTSDFGKDIFPILLEANETIKAYKTAEYLKDIGIPDRLSKAINDLCNGKVARFSKRNKRPAIFIDRDGTLIKNIDLLYKIDALELYEFSASAVKKINQSDYLCFLITNQPVVARNLCDISAVKQMHNKIETLLGKEGAYLNDIYFCPHHPDKGYLEENPKYKIDCDCRKPKTAMVNNAIEEYNVDIKDSWFIGDTTTDIQTARNAGIKTILVKTGRGGEDKKYKASPDFVFDNIENAVDFIISSQWRLQ